MLQPICQAFALASYSFTFALGVCSQRCFEWVLICTCPWDDPAPNERHVAFFTVIGLVLLCFFREDFFHVLVVLAFLSFGKLEYPSTPPINCLLFFLALSGRNSF